MENVTYVFNISTQGVTDVTVTNESTGVTQHDTTTMEQTTATNDMWSRTASVLSSITGNPQTTVHFTNQTSLTTQSEYDNYNEYDNYSYYDYNYGDVYMYPGYTFERPFYLYIWEFLVIFTFLINLVVISVLLRRKMRNSTNIVLTTIAISDSLTGLVTLPSYIMVYLKYVPADSDYEYDYNSNYSSSGQSIPSQNKSEANYSFYDSFQSGIEQEPVGGCELTEDLCNGFMISKYFLSKSFHSMSIFLTLFLGIQRYISIRYPYRSQLLLNLQRTIICCVTIVLISPVLHVYHLVEERAAEGLCQWELKEQGCGSGCVYLWMAFFIRHLIPCVALVVFTTLFILQLRSGERTLRRMDSSQSQMSRRRDENRRISIIVIAVVIVFLIPEIPYGIFLLYNALDKTTNQGKGIELETNRAIHLIYELLMVLSFHANFYIYTFFNRRFRKTLCRTYLNPVRRLFGDTDRLSMSTTSSVTRKISNRKTDTGQAATPIEMESMIKSNPPRQPVIKP